MISVTVSKALFSSMIAPSTASSSSFAWGGTFPYTIVLRSIAGFLLLRSLFRLVRSMVVVSSLLVVSKFPISFLSHFPCYGIVTSAVRGSEYGVENCLTKIFFGHFSSTSIHSSTQFIHRSIHTNYKGYPPKSKVFRPNTQEMHKYLCTKKFLKNGVEEGGKA